MGTGMAIQTTDCMDGSVSNLIEQYGIKVGDIYNRADGARNKVIVIDVTTYSFCDDVVIADYVDGNVDTATGRRTDAFKLHCVRYYKP